MHINDLLKIAVERKASDLHLKVGAHPIIRVDGELIPLVDLKRLMQEDTIAMAFSIMSSRQKEKFKNNSTSLIRCRGSGASAATSSSSAARSEWSVASSRLASSRSVTSSCRRFSRESAKRRADSSS